jgi:hypothetical protein
MEAALRTELPPLQSILELTTAYKWVVGTINIAAAHLCTIRGLFAN